MNSCQNRVKPLTCSARRATPVFICGDNAVAKGRHRWTCVIVVVIAVLLVLGGQISNIFNNISKALSR